MPVKDGAPAISGTPEVAGIMIGAPMYGGVCYDAFLLGVWDLQHECHRLGITLGMCIIRNESLIPRARNRILADFMESRCSHLIMIDADIGFAARDVLRLVAHDKPLIGATYAKKDRTRYAPAFVPLPDPVFQREDDGLMEVQCLPGGFLMMRRDVVAHLREGFPEPWYWDQHGDRRREIHDLFATYTDTRTRQFWSEDYAFCQRWRQVGGKVWLDPYIMLTHNGTTTFDSDPTSVLGEVPAPVPLAGAATGDNAVVYVTDQRPYSWEQVKTAMGPASYGTAAAQPEGAILPTPAELAGIQAVA